MKAIALRRGAKQVELLEMPQPVPRDGEVLVQAIRTGVCGTDREMILRQAVDTPPGEEFLVLGHEGLGRVVETRGEVGGLRVGDLVVPIVRRGCGQCNACNTGHPDMCFTGKYTERGIHRQHGFFSEFYADRPEYLVKAPPDLEDAAVLGEPMSVSVKAAGIAVDFQKRVLFAGAYSQRGRREPVLIAGHGPIGMLGLLVFLDAGFDVWVLGRRPPGDTQVEMIESAGARYVRGDQMDDLVRDLGGFFIIFEATGLAEVTFQLAGYLSRNGVLLLTGVPRGPKGFAPHTSRGGFDTAATRGTGGRQTPPAQPRGPKGMQIDGNALMASLVRYNQGIIGSVNACAGCFQSALAMLGQLKRKYPDFMRRIFTSRYSLDQWEGAFAGKKPDDIKVTIEFEPA